MRGRVFPTRTSFAGSRRLPCGCRASSFGWSSEALRRRERRGGGPGAWSPNGTDARVDHARTMAARTKGEGWVLLAAQLQELGFARRAGQVFTREVADNVLGWLGLNRASRHQAAGVFEVNPVIGIRHQEVERVVAELRAERFHPYQPPTVSMPLGYLMPGERYRAWIVDDAEPESSVEDLAAAVAGYGLGFVDSGVTLGSLCTLLDKGFGFEHQLVYRRPVAWVLDGDIMRAVESVNSAELALDGRDDPAAMELRSFIAAFRDRFGVR